MNNQILKAHALVAQKKLSPDDFNALILGVVAGNRKVKPKDYSVYLASPGWKRKSEAAKKAVGYRCQVCNRGKKDGVILNAHHRTYDRVGHELPEDITVLCDECHKLYHLYARVK